MGFERENPKRFRIVAALAGVDDTDSSSFVVETASSRARSIVGAELHLVHVVASPGVAPSLAQKLGPWTAVDLVARGRAYLEGMQRFAEATFRGRVIAHLVEGEPWHEIVNVAENLSADLLVIGRRRSVGLADGQPGIVSELVVDHATCRVLVVRPKVVAFEASAPMAPPSGNA